MGNTRIEFDYHLNPGSYVEGEAKKYHVRINSRETVGDKEISEYLERACTLTRADIAAALVGLRDAIVDSLAKGRAVNLGGICRIEPVLGVAEGECRGDEDGSEVTLKAVRMRPSKSLENDVRERLYPCARRRGRHSAGISRDELYDRLTGFFRTHASVTRRDMEEHFGLTGYMARKFIRQFVAEGALCRPRNLNDSEYRPAPGHFGNVSGTYPPVGGLSGCDVSRKTGTEKGQIMVS